MSVGYLKFREYVACLFVVCFAKPANDLLQRFFDVGRHIDPTANVNVRPLIEDLAADLTSIPPKQIVHVHLEGLLLSVTIYCSPQSNQIKSNR